MVQATLEPTGASDRTGAAPVAVLAAAESAVLFAVALAEQAGCAAPRAEGALADAVGLDGLEQVGRDALAVLAADAEPALELALALAPALAPALTPEAGACPPDLLDAIAAGLTAARDALLRCDPEAARAALANMLSVLGLPADLLPAAMEGSSSAAMAETVGMLLDGVIMFAYLRQAMLTRSWSERIPLMVFGAFSAWQAGQSVDDQTRRAADAWNPGGTEAHRRKAGGVSAPGAGPDPVPALAPATSLAAQASSVAMCAASRGLAGSARAAATC